jgi:catechol 2,3-dioxygenase-like lactoylglutathione lyase family enzyme
VKTEGERNGYELGSCELHVADVDKSIAFYSKFRGAKQIMHPGPLEIGVLPKAFEGSHGSQDGAPSQKGDLHCVRFQRFTLRRAEVCCSNAWPLSELPELACAAAGMHFALPRSVRGGSGN